jgi:hypothetical protein
MVESRFHTSEVVKFMRLLSVARKPSDLLMVKAVLGRDSYGISAMVSFPFYESSSYFPSFAIPFDLRREYIVPYLCHPYVYFINHERIVRPSLRIDYTVTFDTNFASYINRFVRGEPLKGQQDEFMRVINDVLDCNLNFDPSFYFMENIKKAYPIALKIKNDGTDSPQMLWELLDEEFRRNIVSLELFLGVDCGHYQKTRELKFDISIEEAVKKSIDFTYWFYASAEGQELISDFLFRQKAILLQLLVILRIQFSSSRGARNKIKEFLDFVQEKWVYSDRETIVAHKYFKDRKMIPLLGKINKGGVQRRLMGKIDNLAWDMTAPRSMERMAALQLAGDYMVPFFLTLDRKLRELIRCYPVKALIIDRRSGGVSSIPEMSTHEYFKKEGCEDIVTSFFSEEKRRERFSKEVPTLEILSDMIDSEYKQLSAILNLSAKDFMK